MDDSYSDLLDECDGLRRRLGGADVAGDASIGSVAAMLDAALESTECDGGVAALDKARRAFYELPESLQSRMLGGWSAAGPRPPRRDLLAALELASIRRLLSIVVTERTIIPSHEWALREGSVVRLEIQEGAALEQVVTAMNWAQGTLQKLWEMAIKELGAVSMAKTYQRVDMRKTPEAVANAPARRHRDRTAFEG